MPSAGLSICHFPSNTRRQYYPHGTEQKARSEANYRHQDSLWAQGSLSPMPIMCLLLGPHDCGVLWADWSLIPRHSPQGDRAELSGRRKAEPHWPRRGATSWDTHAPEELLCFRPPGRTGRELGQGQWAQRKAPSQAISPPQSTLNPGHKPAVHYPGNAPHMNREETPNPIPGQRTWRTTRPHPHPRGSYAPNHTSPLLL